MLQHKVFIINTFQCSFTLQQLMINKNLQFIHFLSNIEIEKSIDS